MLPASVKLQKNHIIEFLLVFVCVFGAFFSFLSFLFTFLVLNAIDFMLHTHANKIERRKKHWNWKKNNSIQNINSFDMRKSSSCWEFFVNLNKNETYTTKSNQRMFLACLRSLFYLYLYHLLSVISPLLLPSAFLTDIDITNAFSAIAFDSFRKLHWRVRARKRKTERCDSNIWTIRQQPNPSCWICCWDDPFCELPTTTHR